MTMNDRVMVVERTDRVVARVLPAHAELVDTPGRVREAALQKHGLWVAPSAEDLVLFNELMTPLVRLQGEHRLIVRDQVGHGRSAFLRTLFRDVISTDTHLQLLPVEELIEVVSSPNRTDLLVGVAVDEDDQSLVFYRGSLEPIVVPLSFFADCNGERPELSDFEVVEYGQAVRFGDCEASSDAILYAYDPEYRRRQKAGLMDQDESFGGALRRLRRLRGLSRDDFPGISPKEIARLERGEVQHPHVRTLSLIADRLGVLPDEISTY